MSTLVSKQVEERRKKRKILDVTPNKGGAAKKQDLKVSPTTTK